MILHVKKLLHFMYYQGPVEITSGNILYILPKLVISLSHPVGVVLFLQYGDTQGSTLFYHLQPKPNLKQARVYQRC